MRTLRALGDLHARGVPMRVDFNVPLAEVRTIDGGGASLELIEEKVVG